MAVVAPTMVKMETPIKNTMAYGNQCAGHERNPKHTHHDANVYPMNTTAPKANPTTAPVVMVLFMLSRLILITLRSLFVIPA